jgi:hypothetical protein
VRARLKLFRGLGLSFPEDQHVPAFVGKVGRSPPKDYQERDRYGQYEVDRYCTVLRQATCKNLLSNSSTTLA